MRNVNKKPRDINMAVENQSSPRHIVPIQLKIFMPVGTAIKRLMIEKKGRSTTPVVNMWCAHTPKGRRPNESVGEDHALEPEAGFLEKTAMISVAMPKNGRARI